MTRASIEHLRRSVAARVAGLSRNTNVEAGGISGEEALTDIETLGALLRKLEPRDESQRALKATALLVYGEGTRLR